MRSDQQERVVYEEEAIEKAFEVRKLQGGVGNACWGMELGELGLRITRNIVKTRRNVLIFTETLACA